MKVAIATPGYAVDFKDEFPGIVPIYNKDDLSVYSDADLVIFPGGSDVSPSRYKQTNNGSYGINLERDDREFSIFSTLIRLRKTPKMLGICRGVQLLNVGLGGSLIQDLERVGKFHDYVHKVEYDDPDNPLAWLGTVNSLHHQALDYVSTGPFSGYNIICRDTRTKVIEAISWDNDILGVQYHPEMFETSLRKEFFDVVKKWVAGDVTFNNSKRRSSYKSISVDFTQQEGTIMETPFAVAMAAPFEPDDTEADE